MGVLIVGERTLLNLEEFVSDIEGAYDALCRDIRNDPDQFAKARRRYESIGLIGLDAYSRSAVRPSTALTIVAMRARRGRSAASSGLTKAEGRLGR